MRLPACYFSRNTSVKLEDWPHVFLVATELNMIISFPPRDYVSPGVERLDVDFAFPNMTVGDPANHPWPYLRAEIPHNWYVDQRLPLTGFLNRDEVHLVYNNALQFRGRRALE